MREMNIEEPAQINIDMWDMTGRMVSFSSSLRRIYLSVHVNMRHPAVFVCGREGSKIHMS